VTYYTKYSELENEKIKNKNNSPKPVADET